MPTYRLDILVTGTDRASPRLTGFSRALARIGQIAAGILIAGTIRAISDQIRDLAATAFDSIADFERMQISLETLIARELTRPEEFETISTAIRHLSDAEILQLDKLTVKYADLEAALADAVDAHSAAVDEFGEGSIEALRESISVRELRNALAETGDELNSLAAQEGALVSIRSSHIVQTMGLAEALRQAQGPAKQMLDWVIQQALKSPFGEEDVLNALRLAAGYGFLTQYGGEAVTETERLALAQDNGIVTAQRLALAILDLTSAIGEPGDSMVRIVRALGQIRGQGRLLGTEIRQLVNAGVGIDIMAAAMGMTVDEFQQLQEEGKILADEFLPALVEYIEKGLGGSAERLSKTLFGLRENFADLRRVILRNLLGPLVYALEPALLRLYEQWSSPERLEEISQWGETIRDKVLGAWKWIETLYGAIKRTNDFFKNPWEIVLAVTPDDWDVSIKRKIVEIIQDIGDIGEAIDTALGPKSPLEDVGFQEPENIGTGILAGLGIAGGVGTLLKVLGAIGSSLGWIAGLLGVVGIGAGIAGGLWYGNFLGIRDITDDAWKNYIQPAFTGIRNWIVDEGIPKVTELHDEWKEKLWTMWENWKTFVDNDLIPTLIEVRNWLFPKITLALGIAQSFAYTFKERLHEIYTKLKDDTIPKIEELAGKLTENLKGGIQEVSPPLIIMGGTFEAIGKTLIEDLLPNLGEFIKQIGEPLISSSNTVSDVVKTGIAATLARLGGLIQLWVRPALTWLSDKLLAIGTFVAGIFSWVWENVLLPALVKVSSFIATHVAPFLGAILNLLGAIGGLIWLLVWGAISAFLDILRDLGEVFRINVLPRIERMVEILWRFFVAVWVIISTLAKPFIEEFLSELATIAEKAAGVLDWLANAINNVADAINNWVNTHIPDLWRPSSPPPIAQGFMATAEAMDEMEAAYRRNSLLRGRGLSSGISGPLFGGPGAAAPIPSKIIVEGDENNFIVESEQLARFVSHQLREQKLKKISEYMGR